ncbi:hypothetical protein BGY98DRAFT_1103561 [Russula aff. rugulosa BPL654]|nr:hypothetical protein BGY98DRAFT_1103561 [Russula aff. rugulosa BPL654]
MEPDWSDCVFANVLRPVPHSASQNVASACNHAVAEGVKGVVLLESRTGFLEGSWWEPVGRNVLRFAGDISHRLEQQQYEEVLEVLLESKLNDFRFASTDAAFNKVVSPFVHNFKIKDIVEQGHAKAQAIMQQDLDRILHRVKALQSTEEATPINNGNTKAILKEYHTYTRNTVVGTVVPITACLDALK